MESADPIERVSIISKVEGRVQYIFPICVSTYRKLNFESAAELQYDAMNFFLHHATHMNLTAIA